MRSTATAWLAAGRPTVAIEVVATQGSVPRGVGTRMLVGADSPAGDVNGRREERDGCCPGVPGALDAGSAGTPSTCGTIGGGHLEWKAIAAARAMLSTGSQQVQTLRYALGPSLGQCCGGTVTLRLQRLTADALAEWPQPPARFHVQLHGAGHVGRAIAHLLATLDASVDWIDERDGAFAPGPWAGAIVRRTVAAAEDAVPEAPPHTRFLVLTHRHDLDLRIVDAVLRRGDFHFLGLIGSRTKRQRFVHRLHAAGHAPALAARVVCPMGLPSIPGKEPAVIAVAVVAQLLADEGSV